MIGAGNGARTRDLNLGKVALYQLSYSREKLVPEAGLEPARACTRGILSPLCLPVPPLRRKMMEATPGFEPGMEILQTSALPLGYVA